MTAVTQCPECTTRFKVTEAQLEAHDGLVRCGRCHQVFDASEHLHSDEPSPQLDLPIEPTTPDLTPIPDVPGLEDSRATLAQRVQFVEELTEEIETPEPEPADRKLLAAAVLFSLLLLAQSLYQFRTEVAAKFPVSKPLLEAFCAALHCTIPLPQRPELMSIESSELIAEPTQTNIVTLSALLHNRAPYAQSYPSLELTLTDMQDQAVARRIFSPAEYLPADVDPYAGAPAQRDIDARLRLDTTDLKPSGYRLFLYYPR